MTREELAKWVDQLETSMTRAEMAKKDRDLLVVLRLAYQMGRDKLKEMDRDRWKTES